MMQGSNHCFVASSSSSFSFLLPWTREEDKQFEWALVMVPDGVQDRWHHIAAQLPGRSPQEVFEHYVALESDVAAIEAGLVELPSYNDQEDGDADNEEPPRAEERRRGLPWTVKEHRLFLAGLHKYGRGDWRNISRWAVKTRTPTQVASHAQKYYLRKASRSKQSRRKSIHDTTLD